MDKNSQLQSLPDTTNQKRKLDTRMDRIYYSFTDEEVEASLSDADRDYREKLDAAWSLLTQYHSFEQAIPLLKSRFGISRATAYRLLNNATKLYGDVTQVSKQGMRNVLYEYSMKVFQLAASQKPPNLKEMNKSIQVMAKLKGLDQNDQNAFDAELLEAHTYILQLAGNSAKKNKTIDISKIDTLPETEYQEIIEMVEGEGLGDQPIGDILDGKLRSEPKEDEDE